MADVLGIDVEKMAKKNPVIGWVKKHPAASAGILGGAVILAILFNRNTDSTDTDTDSSVYEVADTKGYTDTSSSVDTSSVMADVQELLDTQNTANTEQLNSFAEWLASTMADYGETIESYVGKEQELMTTEEEINPLDTTLLDYAALTESAQTNKNNNQVSSEDYESVSKLMAKNSALWQEIFKTTGKTDTAEQLALHDANLSLSESIGLEYDSVSGTYVTAAAKKSSGSKVSASKVTQASKNTNSSSSPKVKVSIKDSGGTTTKVKAGTDLGNGKVLGNDGKTYDKNDSSNAAMKAGVWSA